MMKFAAQLPKTVDELNEVLRESQEPHDTYLALLGQANEQSVPLLLNRLVLDYGTSEPQNPYVGIICTHAHLVEVLKSITNTDQGLYYPRWAAWWDAHQTLSREQWVLDGFAAIGLHPVEPIDERFALEIIDLLGGRLDYHSYSARWLLASVSQAARERWLTLAASSGQRIRRLGVLEVLRSIDATGQEQLLRKLAADPDLEIRRRALTILNRRLRAMLSAGSARPQGFCRMVPDKYERFSASFAAGLLIVVNSEGVAALDTRTLRTVWGVPARSGVTTSLTDDQAIFLVTESGTLLAIDLNGKALWQRNHMDDAGAITRMLRQGDNLVVLREHMIEQLDAKTGATKLISQVTDTVKDADSSGRFAYFIDDHGLQPFDGGKELRLADLHGISVTSQRVCLTSGPIRSEGRGMPNCERIGRAVEPSN